MSTGYPNLMKTGDPWLLPPHVVERGAYIFFVVWSRHYERPPKLRVLKKRDLCTFLGHHSFWVSGVESLLIFFIQKIRKINKYKFT